jgi:hypothetical protein
VRRNRFLVPKTGQSGSLRAAVVMLFAHAHIVFSKHAVDAGGCYCGAEVLLASSCCCDRLCKFSDPAWFNKLKFRFCELREREREQQRAQRDTVASQTAMKETSLQHSRQAARLMARSNIITQFTEALVATATASHSSCVVRTAVQPVIL